VACHYFVHPNGRDITVVGSSENYRLLEGEQHNASLPFNSDSYWSWSDQELLGTMQLGLVQEVARYCHSAGFWGFCGIDVLLDASGRTLMIDVNPRVTGSLPSLLLANLFHDSVGFQFGIFRRSGPATYYNGPYRQLLDDVARFNRANPRDCQVVVFSFFELHQDGRTTTKIQIGVYGRSIDQCRQVLGDFANEAVEG
jgi:ATP-grasp domain